VRTNRCFCLFALFLFLPLAAGNPPGFPYSLSLKTDVPAASFACLSYVLSDYLQDRQKLPGAADILALNSGDVNFLDKLSLGNYSEAESRWSDRTLETLRYSLLLPYVPLIYSRQWLPVITYSVMYGEAMSISGSLTIMAKALANRPRPYMYGRNLTLAEKEQNGRDGFRSFYSGHASSAFCSATLLSKVFSDRYPSSKYKGLVWGLSLATAAATGVLRCTAGKHFPTDVLAGACMGGLTGYFVPVLHKVKPAPSLSLSPVAGGRNGIRITFKF
jgi:membrane-associated phospholipid phosphatase